MLSILFISAQLWAAIPTTLPTIQPRDFLPGKTWTWDYREQTTGALYSSETYEVTQAKNNIITLEMSTHFPNDGEFHAHHKLEVDVSRCLNSYRNPYQRRPWNFKMYYRKGNTWQRTKPPTTLAFEEKFNCNPHVHDDREFLTAIKNDNLFQQRRWRTQDSSWFELKGPNHAIAAEKIFAAGPGSPTYVMRRRP